jgi:hypothetical protein
MEKPPVLPFFLCCGPPLIITLLLIVIFVAAALQGLTRAYNNVVSAVQCGLTSVESIVSFGYLFSQQPLNQQPKLPTSSVTIVPTTIEIKPSSIVSTPNGITKAFQDTNA